MSSDLDDYIQYIFEPWASWGGSDGEYRFDLPECYVNYREGVIQMTRVDETKEQEPW